MSLSLPADAEPFIPNNGDLSSLHNPGCYALTLTRPRDLAHEWDQVFDHRPPYWDDLLTADNVVYVGASADVLSRLEDHRDSEVRLTVLTEVCDIHSLRNIWWYSSAEEAFERESGLALMLQNHKPSYYVHQN